jgi:threonine dehydrogenase-like Zn-dependent dehydrogenase
VSDDDALLRVEACGLCGSDLLQFEGGVPLPYPVIPGHEIVGVIEEVGPEAAWRWDVKPGDRVAVEPRLVCHRCESCLRGRLCDRYPLTAMRNFGMISTSQSPGLWGGYAEYVYLHPDSTLHHVPSSLEPKYAALFNPLANGIEWAVAVPQPQFGDTVLVLGPGQRGLACVIALKARGIDKIVVTGLDRDAYKLELGARLGAVPVNVEKDDLAAIVREVSNGNGADVVVDTTPHATKPLLDAMDLVRPGGQIVIGGVKHQPLDGFDSDLVIMKDITIRGGVAASHDSYAAGVAMAAERLDEVSLLHTHGLGLDQATYALELLAGEHPSEEAISVALLPNGS